MYYLFNVYKEDDNHTSLFLVESPLTRELTTRLLLHASGYNAEDLVICGVVEALILFIEKCDNIVPLSNFVEPRRFNDDKRGDKWALLNFEEARELHALWKADPRYQESSEHKTNYYKNQVDHFEWSMEKRWSQQTK